MAPIPRCDLRLPSESNDGRRSSQHQHVSPKSKVVDHRPLIETPAHGSQQPVTKVGSGRTPLHSQRSPTRDSAEILERAHEFSTGVTRDAVEIFEHELHEDAAASKDANAGDLETAGRVVEDDVVEDVGSAAGVGSLDGVVETGAGTGVEARAGTVDGVETGPGAVGGVEGSACPQSCSMLEQSRSQVEAGAEAAAAAAAAAVVDDEDMKGAKSAAEAVATPGDVCAQFCKERPESPSSGYSIRKAIGTDRMAKRRSVQKCKGTYASLETYKTLWGSSKAVGARKKLELEMKKKRKYYERVHERNKRRRENERRRAKEKRRMLRCRDQSKIPEAIGDISINKAFYFRFNYNQRLPFLPSAMDQHLKRFKRPPFRRYHKGSRSCRKLVDEFEKLRVPDAKIGSSAASRLPAKAKA